MKTQIETMIPMLRNWCSTADFQAAGITSPHSRLTELRRKYAHIVTLQGCDLFTLIRIKGKNYNLLASEKTVTTRWGKANIVLHKLKAVK